jgi:hypothetical protein|tara:strand:+ start:810 stop:977 length:168 start_codon:yes stop_codon:yes gene_type:complete
MRQVSLCLLLRENKDNREILLAMKKRGFGQERWNGVNGKNDKIVKQTINFAKKLE